MTHRRPLDAVAPRRQLALLLGLTLVTSLVTPSVNPAAERLWVLAAALTVGGLAAVAGLPWRAVPGWVHTQPAVACLLALVVLRQTSTGIGGYLLLALLPVLWLSVHAGRAVGRWAVIGTALGVGLPDAFSDQTTTAALSTLRSVGVYVVVGLVLEHTVAVLVRDADTRASRTLDVAAGTVAPPSAARSTSTRQALCQLVVLRTGADVVGLAEQVDGRLVVTARSSDAAPEGTWVDAGDGSTGAGAALLSGRAVWTTSTDDQPADARLVAGTPARSVLWQPVWAHGTVRAVLVLGFATERRELDRATLAAARAAAGDTGALLAASDRVVALESAAATDPLTGLPNRRWLLERAELDLDLLRQEGRPAAVLMVDLDRFKAYNDAHGHAAGDQVLRDFAGTARRCLREGGVLARWGGEEFVVFLPGCTVAEALVVAGRVREATPGAQTCSVGVSGWDGREPLADVLDRADVAMYRAKRLGRDRVEIGDVADPTLLTELRARPTG